MSEWKFRLAEPADAEAFSRWAATNPQIDQKDLLAGMGKNNPTVLFFVADHKGVAISFAPVYLSATLAHLAFNPDARASEKMQSLNVLTDGVSALMVQYGVREITTLSKEDYGVAKWAVANGFEKEDRQLFKLDLNKILAEA